MTHEPLAARALAFYLPQFLPIPENDEWWGPGFTEWTNAAERAALFPGHRQPTLPADLGFYDLRLPETREAQAELAQALRRRGLRATGTTGSVEVDRILDRPSARCSPAANPTSRSASRWANQTWTGIWHGAPDRVLKEQTYPGPEDDQAHFDEHPRRRSATSATFASTAGRSSTFSGRRSCPTPRAFVDRWQRMARRRASTASTSSPRVSDLLGRGPKYTRAEAGRLRRGGLHAASRRDHAADHARDAGAPQGCSAVPRSSRTRDSVVDS